MVKVVIVGGGALGSAAGFALAEAGCEVTIIDQTHVPNASQVAAGMLAPAMETALDPAAAPHAELLKQARAAWPAFAAGAGIALSEKGAWALGSAEFAARAREQLQAAGFEIGAQGIDAARAGVSGLPDQLQAGVFAPADAVLDAPAALAALRAGVLARGGRWLAGRALAIAPGRLQTSEGDILFDRLIIAAGAGTGLVPDTDALEPIKGHILSAAGFAYDGPVLRGEGVYVAPAARGVRIGATMEPATYSLAVSEAKAGGLQAAAARLLPAIADAVARAQAGIRAATPDGLPWVGPARDGSTLLAVGARRNGWLLAPLAAEALSAYVFDRTPPRGLEALAPEGRGGRMTGDLFSTDADGRGPEGALSQIFFAIRPPPDLAQEIHRFAEAERGERGLHGKTVAPERLHMTAVPVGAYSPEIVHDMLRAADKVSAPAFDMTLDHAGSYERAQGGSPYVLTPTASPGFAIMQTAIHSALRGGMAHRGKLYSPHMTVLYDREARPERAIAPFRWRVREFVLIQSLVGQTVHRELGRWPLAD